MERTNLTSYYLPKVALYSLFTLISFSFSLFAFAFPRKEKKKKKKREEKKNNFPDPVGEAKERLEWGKFPHLSTRRHYDDHNIHLCNTLLYTFRAPLRCWTLWVFCQERRNKECQLAKKKKFWSYSEIIAFGIIYALGYLVYYIRWSLCT